MLIPLATACGKSETNDPIATTTAAADGTTATSETTTAETEPPTAFDSVPAQDFKGHVFNILRMTNATRISMLRY